MECSKVLMSLLTLALVALTINLMVEPIASEELDVLFTSDQNPYVTENASYVRYLLWTRSNMESEDYYLLEWKDLENLQASPFDPIKKTYFVFHGVLEYGEIQWVLDLKTNILKIEDVNVISVDYEELVSAPNIFYDAENMYIAANHTAEYVDWILNNTDLTLSNIHFIGFSLGSHCAGMTGKYMKTGKIERLSGMDPSGLIFYNKTEDERISPDSARFVDIIHTNGCPPSFDCLGLLLNVGHVDFYVNGGEYQPGCNSTGFEVKECAHARAHDYFIESILAGQPNGTDLTFIAWPCEDYDTFLAGGCPDCGQGCLEMGFHVGTRLRGEYYLTTNEESPFAKGSVQN